MQACGPWVAAQSRGLAETVFVAWVRLIWRSNGDGAAHRPRPVAAHGRYASGCGGASSRECLQHIKDACILVIVNREV